MLKVFDLLFIMTFLALILHQIELSCGFAEILRLLQLLYVFL